MSISPPFTPLVTSATTAQSLNAQSISSAMDRGRYQIPSYQRDAEEWDIEKRSLFIESIINNLTIPPLIVYPEDDPDTGTEIRYVIDGQQRLTTLRRYLKGEFALAGEADVDYADNVGPRIQGKVFSKLDDAIQDQIREYVINLIVLPKNLDLSMRLLIFRRINEEGVPLSAHDLRLASFGDCDRVSLIRLAGIRDPNGAGGARMIVAAKKHGVDFPWKDVAPWAAWWGDSRQTTGQTPSEMFLFYVLARMVAPGTADALSALMARQTQDQLRIRYDNTTTSVLDLICAQLLHESAVKNSAQFLPPLAIMAAWFADFERWFNTIVTAKIPGASVPVKAARKFAFFIAAAATTWSAPNDLKDNQWELVGTFLRKGPTDIESKIGVKYPVPKGKWPGQRDQIEATWNVCGVIAKHG